MKITNAWIDDPTLRGKMELPQLTVVVNEFPDVTIPSESFGGGWHVGKYGPFVEYTHDTDKVDAGDFNIRFRNRFAPVVDIIVIVGSMAGPEETYRNRFSLPLSRARQLVRKFDSTWRLLISDKAASDHGTLLWTPVETLPGCRGWVGDHACLDRPARKIHVSGIDLPMCEAHVQEHNARHALKRATRQAS